MRDEYLRRTRIRVEQLIGCRVFGSEYAVSDEELVFYKSPRVLVASIIRQLRAELRANIAESSLPTHPAFDPPPNMTLQTRAGSKRATAKPEATPGFRTVKGTLRAEANGDSGLANRLQIGPFA